MNGPTPDMVREQLGKGLRLRLRLRGRSMLPVVPPGCSLTIRQAGAPDLVPGALVVFEREGRMICHRVEAVAGSWPGAVLRTRGAFLRDDDEPVAASSLVGVVEAVAAGPFEIPVPGSLWDAWTLATRPATAAVQAGASIARRLLPGPWRDALKDRLHL
jgi:hypothetical protein